MAVMARPVDRAAVIGCGTVGTSWAALFSAGGISVRVHDPFLSSQAELDARVAACLPALRSMGLAGQGSVQLCASVADACRDARIVQESTREEAVHKAALLAELDAVSAADAIIASSTSSLLWSTLTARADNPGRIIVAHPFHPAHLIPLVELFGMDPGVVQRARDFYEGLGKVPVILKREARGHIANRLASALYREAVNLVVEDIASVEDVDTALREGPALRWSVLGVHLGYHLGAGQGGIQAYLHHLGASQQKRWEDLGQPVLDDAVRARLVAGIEAAYGNRPLAELEQARDAALIARMQAEPGRQN